MVGPRFSDHDFPDDDVTVQAARGRAVMLPKSARRLSSDSIDLLGEMQALTLEVAEREARLQALTDAGRDMGISWSLLGWVQGLTGEAVRRRQPEA